MTGQDGSSRLLRNAIALIASTVATGCPSPVGTCDQSDAIRTDQYDDLALQPEADGGFVISVGDGYAYYPGRYGSCRDYCSIQPELVSLSSCEGPTFADASSSSGGWTIACDGRWVSCSFPYIINPPPTPGSGRTTEGVWMPPADRVGRSVGNRPVSPGEHFARAAADEAASVHAFRRLAREIAAHDGPPSLVTAAERAAAEEVRHTILMTLLARRYGAKVKLPVAAALPVRPLEQVALENAREGCVRETFGAIVVAFQARRARDAIVHRALRSIACDESEHATLSWSVARWAERRLGARGAADAKRAMVEAIAELDGLSSFRGAAGPEAGLPNAREARDMMWQAKARIWPRA
ncbi:MAG: hypothetical protein ABSE49_30270 [Polyangiaceae bacterium]|jgi:hypothetical protein